MLGGLWLLGLRVSTSSTTILTRPTGRIGSSSYIGERRDGVLRDRWFNLARQEAARKISVGNSMAEEGKGSISSEQGLAAEAAYKTPSPLGLALQRHRRRCRLLLGAAR
jgi:hypothetical protein